MMNPVTTQSLTRGAVTDPKTFAPNQRFAALDAWRGACACAVVLVHVPVAHHSHDAPWFSNMRLFVDFFFVLSGFVICHAYGARVHDATSAVAFMIRRLGRLWPLHMVVLAGFVALELAKVLIGRFMTLTLDGVPFTEGHSISALISNVLLLQAFNLHGSTTWNIPAWSIGVEFYTYAVFAVVVAAWGARRSAFALLAIFGILGVAFYAPDVMFTTHAFGFFRCLAGFFVGCLIYKLMEQGELPRWLTGTPAEVASVALLAAFLATTGENATSLLAPAIFGVIVIVFASEKGQLSQALLCPLAQRLGLWSYSIYMIHMLVFAILKILMTGLSRVSGLGLSAPVTQPTKLWSLGSQPLDFMLIIAHVALVVALARLSYEWIEAPARDWFNAASDRFSGTAPQTRSANLPAQIR